MESNGYKKAKLKKEWAPKQWAQIKIVLELSTINNLEMGQNASLLKVVCDDNQLKTAKEREALLTTDLEPSTRKYVLWWKKSPQQEKCPPTITYTKRD